ncbi:hypothetical protein AOLI_G00086870 [Acnodon oligacanthus]
MKANAWEKTRHSVHREAVSRVRVAGQVSFAPSDLLSGKLFQNTAWGLTVFCQYGGSFIRQWKFEVSHSSCTGVLIAVTTGDTGGDKVLYVLLQVRRYMTDSLSGQGNSLRFLKNL